MSTTYEKAPAEVSLLAKVLMTEVPEHQQLFTAGVKIDYLFARAELDDNGDRIGFAMTARGHRVLGKTRKTTLKERAACRADAEITVDGDWWMSVDEPQQRALLDHELTHLDVVCNRKSGVIQTDDLRRPKLKLVEHDVEAGWFLSVARRNKLASEECRQARTIYDRFGQALMPLLDRVEEALNGTVTIETGGKSVTVASNRFSQIAKSLAKEPARAVVEPHEE